MAFESLAKEGDIGSMCLLSQMYWNPSGYGAIKQDKKRAIEWILRAVDMEDADPNYEFKGEAIAIAKKICPKELKEHMERRKG